MSRVVKTEIKNVEDLADFAEKFSKHLSLNGRQLILLEGEMGSGKTTFVQALVKNLDGPVATSPTFALHHRYETNIGTVDHFDLFRLKSVQELAEIGLWDLLSKSSGTIIVEWSDRIDSSVWPQDWKTIRVRLEFDGKIRTAEYML